MVTAELRRRQNDRIPFAVTILWRRRNTIRPVFDAMPTQFAESVRVYRDSHCASTSPRASVAAVLPRRGQFLHGARAAASTWFCAVRWSRNTDPAVGGTRPATLDARTTPKNVSSMRWRSDGLVCDEVLDVPNALPACSSPLRRPKMTVGFQSHFAQE